MNGDIFNFNKTTIEVEVEHVDGLIRTLINRFTNVDVSLRFCL